jgi:5-formyltetrahydrofolate cyclo-ligase
VPKTLPPSAPADELAAPADELVLVKAQMRKQAAKIRQQQSDLYPQAPEQLAAHCAALMHSFGPGIYAAYLPIRSEISPLPLVAALHRAGQQTAMPITPAEGEALSFRRWAVGDVLEAGPYGTSQPLTVGQPVLPDIILAPLLAFDAAGWRLGYGGGFYDRTIADLAMRRHQCAVIGLGFDGQKLDKVPIGPYDMPLDALLTPSGLHCAKR